MSSGEKLATYEDLLALPEDVHAEVLRGAGFGPTGASPSATHAPSATAARAGVTSRAVRGVVLRSIRVMAAQLTTAAAAW